jgi:hydroquinone glucosyltransferase
MTTSLHLYLPILDQQVSGQYIDHIDPIQIPGCIPIRGQDLPPTFFQDRSSIAYETILRQTKRFPLADGVLINSFSEMEEGTARALMEKQHNNIKNTQLVYLVGPIIQTGSNQLNESLCVKWLENQTPNSVLYVSFGSRGSLSQEQINELALGLELSGQKFLWVLREPSNFENLGDHSAKNDPLKYLPNGFLERTKEQGLVVSFWAPQTRILGHISTGGFLTHCGWNSTLESILLGVPMITWPLFGEQRLNAILLVEGLKVGLKVIFNESGIAEREEIAKVVRDLMLVKKGVGFNKELKSLN